MLFRRGLWIEQATIEKHIEKGHVTHVDINGSGDVNKPNLGDQNNSKCVQKNIVGKSERIVH